MHLVVDEYGIPASGIVTSGTVADCSHASLLMDGLEAEAFPAGKAYDANGLLGMLKEADMAAVIPPVKSRKEQRAYSHELYRARKMFSMKYSIACCGVFHSCLPFYPFYPIPSTLPR